jgi:hypothetical protein
MQVTTRLAVRKRCRAVMSTVALLLVEMAIVFPAVAWAEPGTSPTPGAPITVNPSWENAPWQPKAQTVLNVTAQAALACCVLSLLVGGAALGVGKIAGSYQAGDRGLRLILGGGAGALVIASAAQAVSWLIR